MRRFVWFLLALALAVPAAAQTGRVSAGNSTTALLGSGATFTGAWEDATQAAVVVVTIKADQASATNGVKVEFSSDGINQDFVSTHTYSDTTNGQTFADAMASRFVRVEFVNGAAGQATFRLQTVVRDNGFGGASSGGTASSVTINDPSITTQKAAVNASGQLSITCANCSGSGASAVDRSTFTFGTTSGAPSGGVFDDTPPTALSAGMFAVPRLTTNRAFHVNFRNQAGTEIGTASNPIQVSLANTAANATAVKVDGSAVTQPVSGTVTANQGGTWTVQPGNTANTTAWKVDGSAVTQPISGSVTANLGTLNGAALDASVTGLEVGQASTTSGQKGIVAQGAVTTNAPTYTTAQTDPLSLDTGGLLRVSLKDTPANTTAFKVDGSAVTQPISGTVTATQATGTNLHIVCDSGCSSSTAPADEATFTFGTTPHSPVGGVFQTTATSNALTTGQMGAFQVTAQRALFSNLRNASGTEVGTSATPLQVTGANGTFPVTGTFFQATQPVSIADGSDSTLGAKADAKSTATDTTAVSIMSVLKEISALEQAPASRAVTNAGTFAVQATLQTQTDTVMVGGVNVKEINGVTPLMGAGATGTGAQRVNDVASGATGAAIPASATYVGGLCSGATGGLLCGASIGDTEANVNVTTATTTLIVTGVSGRKIHVTSLRLGPFPSAQTLAWIEGTGATCGTGTAGVEGGTTAATGVSYAANGGERQGTGIGDVLATATAGDSLCLVTGSAVQTSGHLKVAIY